MPLGPTFRRGDDCNLGTDTNRYYGPLSTDLLEKLCIWRPLSLLSRPLQQISIW